MTFDLEETARLRGVTIAEVVSGLQEAADTGIFSTRFSGAVIDPPLSEIKYIEFIGETGTFVESTSSKARHCRVVIEGLD